MNLKTLKKAIKGDKKAFEKIYNEYFDLLWRYIFSRVREREVASDIVSDSFIVLYENIKNIKHPKALKSYLFKIAKNKLIKYYKREKTIPLSEFTLDRLKIRKNKKNKNDNHLSIKLEKVLGKLPDHYAEVLRLRFLSGLKIKEVAEIMGKTPGNIKVLQHRAIKKSKNILKLK